MLKLQCQSLETGSGRKDIRSADAQSQAFGAATAAVVSAAVSVSAAAALAVVSAVVLLLLLLLLLCNILYTASTICLYMLHHLKFPVLRKLHFMSAW